MLRSLDSSLLKQRKQVLEKPSVLMAELLRTKKIALDNLGLFLLFWTSLIGLIQLYLPITEKVFRLF